MYTQHNSNTICNCIGNIFLLSIDSHKMKKKVEIYEKKLRKRNDKKPN